MVDVEGWLIWPIVVPLIGATLALLCGGRAALLVTLGTIGGLLLAVAGVTWQVWRAGVQRYALGGWGAPLGIDLYADGLSAVLLITSTVVGAGIGVYALGYFAQKTNADEPQLGTNAQPGAWFWPLWLFLWAALHALLLSADLFNLYVTLELLGLAAVPLVFLAGERAALTAGMRYLLTSLLGSLAYLLGVALVYATYATLDMTMLSECLTSGPTMWVALTFLTVGLMLKTALFPLHFWLPPAHANAPSPVSALLSALVVKASFYILVRLWGHVFINVATPAAGQMLGWLGMAAILWGSLLALCQQRLKLLVAYSTVAQIGYLFLLFPLTTPPLRNADAWSGGIYHAVSHACAKAAMFLAAGSMLHALGTDRLERLAGIGQRLPLTTITFALAGISLMGLPPSGGFVAKWLLLNAALASGQWWWALGIAIGGLLAAGYVFVVLRYAFLPPLSENGYQPMPRSMLWAPFGLALLALLLGWTAIPLLTLVHIGAAFPTGPAGGIEP
jgi:multicomponent Na+:H+ antiporter subunit D